MVIPPETKTALLLFPFDYALQFYGHILAELICPFCDDITYNEPLYFLREVVHYQRFGECLEILQRYPELTRAPAAAIDAKAADAGNNRTFALMDEEQSAPVWVRFLVSKKRKCKTSKDATHLRLFFLKEMLIFPLFMKNFIRPPLLCRFLLNETKFAVILK